MDKQTEGSVQGSVQMNGEDETFDDQVQCMDLNIETLNEQGRPVKKKLQVDLCHSPPRPPLRSTALHIV